MSRRWQGNGGIFNKDCLVYAAKKNLDALYERAWAATEINRQEELMLAQYHSRDMARRLVQEFSDNDDRNGQVFNFSSEIEETHVESPSMGLLDALTQNQDDITPDQLRLFRRMFTSAYQKLSSHAQLVLLARLSAVGLDRFLPEAFTTGYHPQLMQIHAAQQAYERGGRNPDCNVKAMLIQSFNGGKPVISRYYYDLARDELGALNWGGTI